MTKLRYAFDAEPPLEVDCLLFGFKLKGGLTLRHQRAYFQRLSAAVRRFGLVCAWRRHGLVLVTGAQGLLDRPQRNTLMGWFAHQPESVKLEIYPATTLRQIGQRDYWMGCSDDASETDLDPVLTTALGLVLPLITGCIHQWAAMVRSHKLP